MIKGKLLFAEGHSIKNTDGIATQTLVGSQLHGYENGIGVQAKFNRIVDFIQVADTNVVLVVEYRNHCIRRWDRNNGSVTHMAGQCGRTGSGFANGVGAAAKFRSPSCIIADRKNKNKFLIADQWNGAIRILDIASKSVTTYLQSWALEKPLTILWDSRDDDILTVLNAHSIRTLNVSDNSVKPIAGNADDSGFADGTFAQARFKYSYDVIELGQGLTYLISDSSNNRIRLIDKVNKKVASLEATSAENNSTYEFMAVKALLLVNTTLYAGIGSPHRIVKLNGGLISTVVQESDLSAKQLSL